jgi:hypothetical protein
MIRNSVEQVQLSTSIHTLNVCRQIRELVVIQNFRMCVLFYFVLDQRRILLLIFDLVVSLITRYLRQAHRSL